MTILDFLRDRLAEDEHGVRAVAAECGTHWAACTDEGQEPPIGIVLDADSGGDALWSDRYWTHRAVAVHMARHDPARTLAEVAAKRRLIDGHEPHPELKMRVGERTVPPCMSGDHYDPMSGFYETWPCPVLLTVAAVYADHPGFRAEWSA